MAGAADLLAGAADLREIETLFAPNIGRLIIGLTDVEVIRVEGHACGPEAAEKALSEALSTVAGGRDRRLTSARTVLRGQARHPWPDGEAEVMEVRFGSEAV
jgi:hypothetical protein